MAKKPLANSKMLTEPSYMEVLFQTSIPTGKINNDYKIVSDINLQNLINKLDQYRVYINDKYINIYENHKDLKKYSVLIEKANPSHKVYYDSFTPDNQYVSIKLYVGTAPIKDYEAQEKNINSDNEYIRFKPSLHHEDMQALIIPVMDYYFAFDV